MNKQKIAVIGAGMAGLTAAKKLADGGAQVTIIEKASQAGGRAGTVERDNFFLNQGPHALYKGGAAYRILKEMGIEPAGAAPKQKHSHAYFQGDIMDLPTDAASTLTTRLLSVTDKIEWVALLSGLGKIDQSKLHGITLRQWLKETVKSERVRLTFEAMVRLGTYCNAPEKISAAAAIQQLKITIESGVLYLDHGWHSLVTAVQEKLEVTEIYGAEVTSIRGGSAGVDVDYNGETHHFDSVVLALPPKQVSKLLAKAYQSQNEVQLNQLIERLDQILPSNAACLDICLKELPNPEYIFVVGIDQPLYYSVHSYTANLAPEGRVLIHMAVYLAEGEKGSEVQEQRLFQLLDQLQPGWRSQLIYKRYLPNMAASFGMAQAEDNGSNGIAQVTLPAVPGVFVCGDWVGSGHLLVDAAMQSAQDAAVAALANADKNVYADLGVK